MSGGWWLRSVFRRGASAPLAVLIVGCVVAAEATAQLAPPGDVPELYLLIRSRRYQEALAAAQTYARTGQFPAAVEAIQWILTQPSDVFVRGDGGDYRSARDGAERLLQSLPASARELYQRNQGASAQGQWARLTPPQPTGDCLALVRSHFATEAGYQAAATLVSRWVDDGNADLAAALALRVIDDVAHRRRLTAGFLRRAEAACRAAGRIEDADRIRVQWLNRTANNERTATSGPSIAGAKPLTPPLRLVDAVPLTRPLWSRPLESVGTHPELENDWKQWSAEKRDKDQPTAVGWQPVIVGRYLVYRDVQTIVALDLDSGRPAWRYVTRLGAEQLLNPGGGDRAVARRLQWEFWESLFGNSLTGQLTTDGVRVYALNDAASLALSPRRSTELRDFDDGPPRPAINSLIALNAEAPNEGERLAWSSASGVGQPGRPLAGHAFLGPPAVSGGIVFAMTERDRELVLVALDAVTGELLWRQPVALADRSLLDDRPRSLRACIPTVTRGVVLCPTHVGLLVGVDAVTGELRWYHSCLEASKEARQNVRAMLPPPHRRHSAFAPLVQASGDRAVYLPTQSEAAYCLNVMTGAEHWRTPLTDAEYLGGISDDFVVVIGHASARALSLATGEVLWTSRLEAVPAGTGVLLADGYLQPLDNGDVAALNLKDGSRLGVNFAADRRTSGHLALANDSLVAVGGDGAAAYPQAGVMLKRIQVALQTPSENPVQTLDLADVYLAQGDLAAAVNALQSALSQSLPPPRRESAQRTLREAYFRLLKDRPERAAEWFARLAPLCGDRHQQARLQIAQSHAQLEAGRRDALLPLAAALASNTDDALHAAPHDAGLAVSLPVWLAAVDRRVPLQGTLLADGRSGSPLSPKTVELTFRETLQAAETRAHLARADRAAGRFHAAEVRWLRNQQQSDVASAAVATRELASLYDAAGLSARAAEQLDLLAMRFGRVPVAAGQTGREFVDGWPETSLSKAAWRRRQPVSWPVETVQMRLRPRRESTLADPASPSDALAFGDQSDGLYGEYQRRLQLQQPDAPYEWLLKNWGTTSWLTVFDKAASRPLGTFSIPAGAVWPGKDVVQSIGAAQSFGLSAEIRCLSLMQGATDGLAWTATSSAWTGRTSVPLCGPATPFAAVYQLRNELLVLDPADGRLLWKRDDLEPMSGLLADSSLGLLVDERVVFVLGGDRQTYRIYDLATGELVRQQRIERDSRTGLSATGTLVHHLAETPTGRSLKLWDLAGNRALLDEPIRDRNLWHQIALDKDLVWLTPDGRLRVFDMTLRQRVVDCPLDAELIEGVVSLKALRQGSRYIVNLARNSAVARTENVHEPIRDPLIPSVILKDEIIAVEPGCSRPLWRSVTPYRSFVQWGALPAPVLVGASIVKARQDNQRRWLVIEALDPATGVRLGYSDQLPEMRLYAADYDGRAGVIRLVGDRGDIELQFGPQTQQLVQRR